MDMRVQGDLWDGIWINFGSCNITDNLVYADELTG